MKQLGRPAFPHAAERAYARAIIRRQRVVHEILTRAISTHLSRVRRRDSRRVDGMMGSEDGPPLIQIVVATQSHVEVTVGPPTKSILKAAETVDNAAKKKAAEDFERVATVALKGEFTNTEWNDWVSENVRLIRSIDSRYFAEVEQAIHEGIDGGWSADKLTDRIAERFGVSKTRARVIARDQIGKFHAQADAKRHTEVGITHFIWRTSNDERVRPEHQALEGKTFSYVRGAPSEGLPGQPIQCRCVAEPVIDVEEITDGRRVVDPEEVMFPDDPDGSSEAFPAPVVRKEPPEKLSGSEDNHVVARFLHVNNSENHLPVKWTYPEAGEFEGAQVLNIERALAMIQTGEDPLDDWWKPGTHPKIAFLEVNGFSGESGGLGYSAVKPEDVVGMWVRDAGEGLKWDMVELANELADEGADIEFDEMGFPEDDWWWDYEDELIDRLVEGARPVKPDFVDTLDPNHAV